MNLPIKIDLPESFLDEEVRCGYTVSSHTKAIWAVELDLYSELARICDKYGLRLLADAGTILGAVRHSGFIPWDDDLDFSMSREDYNVLCSVIEKELEYPYFWQTEETDPGSCRGHGQLRNSETTAILQSERDAGWSFNQGIFIDVFPFDNVPDDDDERHKFLRRIGKWMSLRGSCRNILAGINNSVGIKRVIKVILIKLAFLCGKKNIAHMILEKLKIKYNSMCVKNYANFLFVRDDYPDALVRSKEWFKESVTFPFENTHIQVPAGYEAYLEGSYGDWREYVIGGSVHGEIFFDPYRSYKEYI